MGWRCRRGASRSIGKKASPPISAGARSYLLSLLIAEALFYRLLR